MADTKEAEKDVVVSERGFAHVPNYRRFGDVLGGTGGETTSEEEIEMAELTVLDAKIAEVLGLAQAAQGAIDKVSKLVDDEALLSQLEQVKQEAAETEERTTQLVENLDGKKTAVLEKARETKHEATEMMSTYLGEDADALDGFEFLTMAEAAEVGHWKVVGKLNEKAGNSELRQIVEWVTPIQQRHFEQALDGSLRLAAEEDPDEPES